jgi:NAD(P)-dependent dehydrogenase (short-subunit alcohol dehydrogenase family)
VARGRCFAGRKAGFVKSGLLGMTETLAIELGKFAVAANAIAPGFIGTAMTEATAVVLGISCEELTRAYGKYRSVARECQKMSRTRSPSLSTSDPALYLVRFFMSQADPRSEAPSATRTFSTHLDADAPRLLRTLPPECLIGDL